MCEARRDGVKLPRPELDPVVSGLKQQYALKDKEHLVGVRVSVPEERFRHHTHSHDVVIDSAEHAIRVGAVRVSSRLREVYEDLSSLV